MTAQEKQKLDELSDTLLRHCEGQKITDKTVADKIDLLMPLVTLIEPLQNIVKRQEEQEAAGKWMKRLGKFIGFIAMIIGAMGVIIGAAYGMIKAIIFFKE